MYVLLFYALITQPIIIKFCVHVDRGTEKDIEHFSFAEKVLFSEERKMTFSSTQIKSRAKLGYR